MISQPYNLKKVYPGTVEDLQSELSVLTLENIKRYKGLKPKWDDFYEVWLRFGPDAARTILIPHIWDGRLPSVSEVKHVGAR